MFNMPARDHETMDFAVHVNQEFRSIRELSDNASRSSEIMFTWVCMKMRHIVILSDLNKGLQISVCKKWVSNMVG